MSFTNFTTGKSHSFGGEYLELVPHERIRYTDKFDIKAPAGFLLRIARDSSHPDHRQMANGEDHFIADSVLDPRG